MSADKRVILRPLSLVEEGDEVLVGDPEAGTFVTLPPVGGVVISALQRGATVEEAAKEAESFVGEPVDVQAFAQTLRELGFVEDMNPDGRSAERTAPIQGKRWLRGVRSEVARRLFGPAAWTFYAICAALNISMLIARPSLLPRPGQDPFIFHSNIGISALLLTFSVQLARGMHECWHWLAARAIGVKARFGIDHRMMMLVFETDLSQLWTVPRRQRFGPMLAGLAFDSGLLSCIFGIRVATNSHLFPAPALVQSLLAMLAYILISGMLWQSMIFLRTDLYAVLVNAFGCRDLWRVKTLLLRRAFNRLTPEQAAELSSKSDVDIRVGRWFRWLWLAGFLGVAVYFCGLVFPMLATIIKWAVTGLELGPLKGGFWSAIVCSIPPLFPWVLALYMTSKETIFRLLASRRTSPSAYSLG